MTERGARTTVTTLAGSGRIGRGDGRAAAASFYRPLGLWVAASGDVYVADTFNHLIRKIDPHGEVTTVAGCGVPASRDGVSTAAGFYRPSGVAGDASGNLYVADTLNNRIRKISPELTVSTLAGSQRPGSDNGPGDGATFTQPLDLDADAAGNVYVADSPNNLIRKVAPDGDVSLVAGSGLAGAADGAAAQATFAFTAGVAVDRHGDLYVADAANHRIRKVSAAGRVSTHAGCGRLGREDGAALEAHFAYPSGVAVDDQGNVYVADTNNHRIRKISAEGVVSTLAGHGRAGREDGDGPAAGFYSPSDVAVDGLGNVYVADSFNNLVRRISAR